MSGDKNKWEWQGKTREQVEFSTLMAGMGVLFMIQLELLLAMKYFYLEIFHLLTPQFVLDQILF